LETFLMAARTSASIGVGVTITLLAVACLTLFILMIVFLSKYQATNSQLVEQMQGTEIFVRTSERQRDDIGRLRDAAQRQNKSVLGYLNDSWQDAAHRVAGARTLSPDQLTSRLDAVEGAASSNLLAVIRGLQTDMNDLRSQLQQAEADRLTALEDRANEAARVKQLQEQHQRTIATLNNDIDRYRSDVESFRGQVDDAKRFMDGEVERIRDRSLGTESSLNDRIRRLESENLQLVDRLSKLQTEKTDSLLKPTSEAALVDGSIIGLNQAGGSVTIDRGRRDKIILGMTFAVYSDATGIRPHAETGEYPPGKAMLEVTHVGETSSTARIISETRGNPVVRGDVIANAIYDPNKVYTFLVFGNFDANGDGHSTPGEASDIRAMIEAWGGRVVDELSGDVDFLILGQRPVLPPRPGVGSPWPVVEEFMRLDSIAQRYDRLWEQAVSTSLPVLNENRLYTLIGRTAVRRQ
jgi:soluble cytochrome b562